MVVGGVVAVGFAIVFAATVLPHVNPALTNYWSADYLTGGPLHAIHQSWTRLGRLASELAMPAVVFVALFVVGIVALVRLRAVAVAIAVPFLWTEIFVAARLHKYPILDQRTFHFVLIPTIAVIAIGVVAFVFEVARRQPVVAVVVGVVAAGLFVHGVTPWWREFGVPHEDTRTAAQFVADNAKPGDIVVVNSSANWGFAYYARHDAVFAVKSDTVATGFVMRVRDPNVLVADGRDDATVLAIMREAVARQRQAGPASRIFIVRTHLSPPEELAWKNAFVAARRASAHRFALATSPCVSSDPVVEHTAAGRAAPGREWAPPLPTGPESRAEWGSGLNIRLYRGDYRTPADFASPLWAAARKASSRGTGRRV